MTIQQMQTEINKLQSSCDGTKGCPDDPFCGSINFSACGRISLLKSAIIQEGRKSAQTKKAQELQEITFNEQINSGDFNETPITDINLDGGCSECTTGTDLETGMTNDQLEKEPLNYMKFAGIAAIGIVALLVVRK